MANKIQIKRSTTNAAPTGLANGELAYTANGEILFLGHPDGVTGSIAIGGRRVPGTLTANQALVANSSSAINEVRAGQVNAITTSAVGANVVANTSALLIGNSSVNSILTSTQLSIGTTVANTTGLFVGASVFANSSAFDVGNTIITTTNLTLGGQITANGSAGSAGQVLTSGAAGNTYWSTVAGTTYDLLAVANTQANQGILQLDPSSGANDDVFFVGANGVVVSSNSSAILITGQIDTNTTYDLVHVANTQANEGRFRLSSSALANDDIIIVGANGVVVSSNSSAVLITGQIDTNTTYDLLTVANTTVGVITLDPSSGANDDIRFIGAGGVTISSDAGGNVTITGTTGDITAVTAGNGLTGGGTSGDVTLTVNANTGIIANASGVFVNPVLTLTDLTVSGNLDINGTLTTVDTTNLSVTDSIISLARGQTTANTLDIGFYGTFGNGSVTSYSGLFRDATDSKYKLFTGAIPEPTTTVDTANVNYVGATLVVQNLEGANTTTSTIDLFIIDGGTF